MDFLLRKTGYTITFYRKENDTKLSFLIKNEPELTEKVLNSVNTKRVKQKNIKYVLPAIDELINNNNFKCKDMSDNPIVILAEKVQAKYGRNLEFGTPSLSEMSHCPIVTVTLYLPNGVEYTESATNQKLARRKCAERAIAEWMGYR